MRSLALCFAALLFAPPAAAQIQVTQASYGANSGASLGNATSILAAACNGQTTCSHTVLVPPYPDPAPGKQKDYRASWTCSGGPVQTVVLPAAASLFLPGVGQPGPQSVLTLTCTPANPPGSPCTNWPPLLRLDLTPYTELAPNAAGVLSWPDGKAAEIWLRTSLADPTLKKFTLTVKP